MQSVFTTISSDWACFLLGTPYIWSCAKLGKNLGKWLFHRFMSESLRSKYELDWVGFYGISTNIGHLMPNPVYTYILNIYLICKNIVDNEAELFFFHTVKLFQVLLYNSHSLTSVIYLHTVCSIWPIDRTVKC